MTRLSTKSSTNPEWPRSIRFGFVAVGLMAVVLSAHAAEGLGCYTAVALDDENGHKKPIEPVCRVLEQNLNHFCEEPPSVCGLKVAPEWSSRLSFPTWTTVHRDDQIDFVRGITTARLSDAAEAEDDWKRFGFENAIRSGDLTVSEANIDVYGLGRPTTVYRMDPNDCEKKNAAQLQTKNKSVWNTQLKSSGVAVYLDPKEVTAAQEDGYAVLSTELGDLFFFDGRSYVFSMGFPRPNPALGTENLMFVNQGSTRLATGKYLWMPQICEIVYRVTEENK